MKNSLNKKGKGMLLTSVLLISLAIGVYAVSAENNEGAPEDTGGRRFLAMRGWGMHFRRGMGSLTEEQRNELSSEMHDLITSKFEEWGIEPPEPLLTEDQREQLKSLISEMREADAAPEDIRKAIEELLDEFGVELPPLEGLHFGKFAGRGRFMCRCQR